MLMGWGTHQKTNSACCPVVLRASSGVCWGTVRNRQLWLDLLSLEWTRRFRSVASRLGRYHLVHQYLRTRGLPPEHELSPMKVF
jgi:hypothetical protein